MSKIKSIINKSISNIKLLNIVYGILGFAHNKKLDTITSKLSSIDSIADFDKFKEEIAKYPYLKNAYTYKRVSDSSFYYGYLKSICEYAGVDYPFDGYVYLEHGIGSRLSKIDIDNCVGYIFQGDYCKNEIGNKYGKYMSVGPYIHYARQYYSEKVINEIKKNNGKTLLFFLTHSCFDFDIDSKGSAPYYTNLFNKLSKEYDRIFVSVYWRDVDDGAIKIIENFDNVQLVSAGFINDSNFVSRLKTIISLCDDVLVNDIGTNVGFAKYMGKKIIYDFSNIQFENVNKELISLKEAIESDNDEDKMYAKMWGDLRDIKSKEELKAFFDGCKEIFEMSKGNRRHYEKSYMNLLDKWKNDNNIKYDVFHK